MPDSTLPRALSFAQQQAAQSAPAADQPSMLSISSVQQMLSGGASSAPPATSSDGSGGAQAWLDPTSGDVSVAGHVIKAADTPGMRAVADLLAKAGDKAPSLPAPGAGWLPIDAGTVASHAKFLVDNQSAPMGKTLLQDTASFVHNLPQTVVDVGGAAAKAFGDVAEGQTINSLAMSGALNGPNAAQRLAQVDNTAQASNRLIDQTIAAHPAVSIPLPDAALHPSLTPEQQIAQGPDADFSSKAQLAGAHLTAALLPALLTHTAGGALSGAVTRGALADSDVAAALGGADQVNALKVAAKAAKVDPLAAVAAAANESGSAGAIATLQKALANVGRINTATSGAQEALNAAQFASGGSEQARAEAQQQLKSLSADQLAKLPNYAALRAQGLSDADARQTLVAQAGQAGAGVGAAGGLLFNMMLAGLLPKLVGSLALPTKGGAGVGARLLRGAATGAENVALVGGTTAAQGAAAAQATGLPQPDRPADGAGLGAAGLAGFLLGAVAPGPHGPARSYIDPEASVAKGSAADLSDVKAAMDGVLPEEPAPAPAATPAAPAPAAAPDPNLKATQDFTPEGVEGAATGAVKPAQAPAPDAQGVEQVAQPTPAGPPSPAELQLQLAKLQQAMASMGKGSRAYRQARVQAQQLTAQLAELQAKAQAAGASAPEATPMATAPEATPAAPAPQGAPGPAGEPAEPPKEVAPTGDRPMGVQPQPIPMPVSPEQAAQQGAAEAARGNPVPATAAPETTPVVPKTDVAPPLAAVASAPEPKPALAPTAPEPKGDVAAQIAAVGAKEKPAAFFTAEQRGDIPTKLPPGVFRADRPEGTLLTRSAKLRNLFTNAIDLDEATMGRILGYDASKAQTLAGAAASGAPPVAVRVSRAGRVLHEELTTAERAPVLRESLRKQYKRAKIEIVTPEQVVTERAGRRASEGTAPTQPTVEITDAQGRVPMDMVADVQGSTGFEAATMSSAGGTARFPKGAELGRWDMMASNGKRGAHVDVAKDGTAQVSLWTAARKGAKRMTEKLTVRTGITPENWAQSTKAFLQRVGKGDLTDAAEPPTEAPPGPKPEAGVEAPAPAETPSPEPPNGYTTELRNGLAAHLHDIAKQEEATGTLPGDSDFVRHMRAFGATRYDHTPVSVTDLMRLRGAAARGSLDEMRGVVDRFYDNGKQYPDPMAVGRSLRLPPDAAANGMPPQIGATKQPVTGTGRLLGPHGAVEVVGHSPDILRAGATVHGWVQQLKTSGLHFMHSLRIMEPEDYAREYGGNIDAMASSGGFMGYRRAADGSVHAVIVVKPPKGQVWGAPQVTDLAHEMGHYVESELFTQLGDEEQGAVEKAFQTWRLKAGEGSAKDAVLSRVGAGRQADLSGVPEERFSPEYALDRREWVADQIGRWLTTHEKPHSVVERYFSAIARALRSLWTRLTAEYKLPDVTVASILNRMISEAHIDALAREAALAPDAYAPPHGAPDKDAPHVGVGEASAARVRELGAGVAAKGRAVLDASSAVLSGDLGRVKTALGRVRDSRGAARARTVLLQFRPLNWYPEMAEAHHMVSAPHYHAINVLYDKANAAVSELLRPADMLAQMVAKRSPEARQLLQLAQYEASTHGVSLDKPWDHPHNAHLHSPDPQIEAAHYRTWQDGQKRFAQLKRAGVDQLYVAMRDYSRRMYSRMLKAYEDEINRLDVTTPARQDALGRLQRMRDAMNQGDYWPKVRDGDYIVKAQVPVVRSHDGDNPDGTFSDEEAAHTHAKHLQALNPHADVAVKKFATEEGAPEAWSVETHVPAVWMFRSLGEAKAARPQMLADLRDAWTRMGFGAEFDDFAKQGDPLSAVKQKTDLYNYDKEVPPQFLRSIDALVNDQKIGPQAAQVLRDMYLHSVTENSWLKSTLRDRNVLGASKSMLQGWAMRTAQSAYHLSRLEARHPIDAKWHELQSAAHADLAAGHANAVTDFNEFYRMHTAMSDELKDSLLNKIAGAASDMTTIATMGLSPKYLLMQAPQPYLTTMPLLAGKIGARDALHYVSAAYDGLASYYTKRGVKELVDGFKHAVGATAKFDPSVETAKALINRAAKTKNEAAALQELFDRSVLDFNWNNQLRDIARGGTGQLTRNLLRMSMAFNSQIEAMNRVVSALAAYRAGVEKLGMGHGDAVEFAQRVTDKSQGNYRVGNRSGFLRGVSGKTVGKFKLWTLSMYHLFAEQTVRALHAATPAERKEALRTLGYLLSTHASWAGLAGLGPMYAAISGVMWLAHHGAVAAGLTPPGEDDYKDKETLMHEFWRGVGTKLFGAANGERFARDLEKGVVNELGVDFSEMSGIPNLVDTKFSGARATDSGYDRIKSNLFALLGPVIDTPFRAAGDALDGRWGNAAARFAPAALRFAYRAVQLDMTGSPSGGRNLFGQGGKATPWDVALQTAGVPSSHVNDAYDVNDRVRSTAAELQAAARRIVQAYAADPTDDETRRRIERFNASVPAPFRIRDSQLNAAVRGPRTSRQEAYLQNEER